MNFSASAKSWSDLVRGFMAALSEEGTGGSRAKVRQLVLGQTTTFMAKSGGAELHQIQFASLAEGAAQPFPLAAGAGGAGCGPVGLVAFRPPQAGACKGAAAAAASGC